MDKPAGNNEIRKSHSAKKSKKIPGSHWKTENSNIWKLGRKLKTQSRKRKAIDCY